MLDAADVALWSFGALLWSVRHLLCCSPETGSCNLRTVEMERHRAEPAEWAAFQLAAHSRADVLNAMAALWPVTVRLAWERLSDEAVRELPFSVQALWICVIQGPSNDQENRIALPAGQASKSRLGMVSWAAAERITRRNHKVIQEATSDAIRQMLRVLNGPDAKREAPQDIRYFACSPTLHVFAVGGTPHPEGRCWCLEVTWREWVKAG